MIPAGALAYFPGTFLRAPFELLSRQMQTGIFETEEEAVKTLLSDQETLQQNLSRSWVLVLLRGLPFGALQQLGEVVKFGCDPIDTQYPSILNTS